MSAIGLKEVRGAQQPRGRRRAAPRLEPLKTRAAALTPRGPAGAQGCKLMLMGSADAIPTAPSAPVVFVEDLPDAAQAKASMARATLRLSRPAAGICVSGCMLCGALC